MSYAGVSLATCALRYSYYLGDDDSLSRRMPGLRAAISGLHSSLEGSPALKARAVVACATSDARLSRNQGDSRSAAEHLARAEAVGPTQSLPDSSRRQIAFERANLLRYEQKYLEALHRYTETMALVDSDYSRVALVHYFAATACELLLDVSLKPSEDSRGTIAPIMAALRLLTTAELEQYTRRFPMQYAYICKHQAIIQSLSGLPWEDRMAEAHSIMSELGSRKGLALVTYTHAAVLMTRNREGDARAMLTESSNDFGYYPPLRTRVEALLGSSSAPALRPTAAQAHAWMREIAVWVPAFRELLNPRKRASDFRNVLLTVATRLSGETFWADRVVEGIAEELSWIGPVDEDPPPRAIVEALRGLRLRLLRDIRAGELPPLDSPLAEREIEAYVAAGVNDSIINRLIPLPKAEIEEMIRRAKPHASPC